MAGIQRILCQDSGSCSPSLLAALHQKSFSLWMIVDKKERMAFPSFASTPRLSLPMLTQSSPCLPVTLFENQMAKKPVAWGPCLGQPCNASLVIEIQRDLVMKKFYLDSWGKKTTDFKLLLPVYFKSSIFISVIQKKSIHTLSKHLLGMYYRLVAILVLGYSPE